MQDQPKYEILRPLTGIRGLTVLWVVIFHFSGGISVLAPALRPLALLSDRLRFRLDLLFMLSGFLMAYVYVQKHEQLNSKVYREFLWARITRFYPTYLVAMLIMLFTVGIARLVGFPFPDHYRLQVLPVRLIMAQAWPFLTSSMWSWNFPTWFLSALLFGYLSAIPCIWKLFTKLRVWRFTLPLVFILILAFKLLYRFQSLSEFRAVFQAFSEMFAGGALCALYLERKPFVAAMQRHLDKIVLLTLGCFVWVLRVSDPLAHQIVNSLLVLACPIFVAGLTAERSLTAKLLVTRPVQWMGKISYSLFVCHAVVLVPLRGLLPPNRFAGSPLSTRYAVLAFYVSAILIAAVAMYKFVEFPCAKALKRPPSGWPLTSRRKPVVVPQPAITSSYTAASVTSTEGL
jgi:peptidoglycan/LPS O-acetylase OafA/YrhL